MDTLIKTLDQLAEYINASDDYPLDVEDICEKNNWTVCASDWDIAIDTSRNEKLCFSEDGSAVTVPYHGGARVGSGRPSVYSNKKRYQIRMTEDLMKKVEVYAAKEGVSKADAISYIIDCFFSSK